MLEYSMAKQALIDLALLRRHYPNIIKKFETLVLEICEKKYKLPQTGKPEPLKGNLSGCWSKRLTNEDRIIYKILNITENGKEKEVVRIYSCKGHYE